MLINANVNFLVRSGRPDLFTNIHLTQFASMAVEFFFVILSLLLKNKYKIIGGYYGCYYNDYNDSDNDDVAFCTFSIDDSGKHQSECPR